ncbi:phospholipase D family protein [Nitratireductor alexandrii]|uniref:phospholipase D family protein n=1 Tax=Nitratireductor alexandrii TaxID=2448161 RepID=UPI000FDBFC50|nr:phospholipase D family protein [Nitratireductor alexandrii]
MLSLLKWLLGVSASLGLLIVSARLLLPLPDLQARTPSTAIPLSKETAWGRGLAASVRDHPEKSGVLPLATGHEALASRLLLTAQAERSLDVQYYIWHDDVSGRLLLRALADAARRGVRVRLLLDDNGVSGMDATLAALNTQDDFEVRLFNPSRVRRLKLAGFVFDFFRMNRRMHNKAFIVDGAAAIIGGRNVGDEYFSIGEQNYFLDLDVLAAGTVVPETAANFDRYWNSQSAYPIDAVAPSADRRLPDWLTEGGTSPEAEWLKRMPELEESVAGRLNSGDITLEWTDVRLFSDPPSKGLGRAKPGELMISQLGSALGPVRKRLDVISAYFVPGKGGMDYFKSIRNSGTAVTILTNALKSTDVAMVHAGYSKYRRRLLKAGIALYELKPRPGLPDGASELSATGSSGSSLHAKTLSVDGQRVFVGSFNFDPRSVHLNCEMGFLIESASMARRIHEAFTRDLAHSAYRVELQNGELRWIETGPDGTTTALDTEPGASLTDRIMVTVFGWLPIEWLL